MNQEFRADTVLSGSTNLIRKRGLQDFENACSAHTATDAHRHANALGTTAFALDQGMAGQALTCDAVRMADGNGAAVDVEPVHGNAQLVGAIQHLHSKGFVEFPQINVVDAQA